MATKHNGDTDNRPKAMKHTGDTDNRPKAVKRSGDTINRPKATKRTGDTDNLRNDAKYSVKPNGNPIGLFFRRVGSEKLAEARSHYGNGRRADTAADPRVRWTGRGPCEREEVCLKYLGPKNPALTFE